MATHPRATTGIPFMGMTLATPLIAAAGTCGYVRELVEVVDPRWLGAVVTKSITCDSREGHVPWRMVELPRASGMINAIGLANMGLDRFIRDELPHASSIGTNVIVSIAGHSIDEYANSAAALASSGKAHTVELNVSCPNTSDSRQFAEDATRLRELVAAVRSAAPNLKLIVKLSPAVSDIVSIGRAAMEGGGDALTIINTMPGLAIDVESRTPLLSNGSGGVSGPAIHPIAVRMVAEVRRALGSSVPIIGLGGVLHWQDAAELILAGANAIGIGTALFVSPAIPKRIARGLEDWVVRQGCASITELVGALRPPASAVARAGT